jgi:predicted nucleotidyltransferase component of viral defense system
MLSRNDIQRLARDGGVPATTVEKDQLLDVVLDQVALSPDEGVSLCFKGGTAIRKLYIPDYRFSEDLDFTFEGDWDMPVLRHWLSSIAEATERATGLSRRGLTVRESRDVPGEEALDAHLLLGSALSSTLTERVKFDITHFEHILDPIMRPLSSGSMLRCYSLEEILAEKVRSLFQRVRPRDLFDVASLASRADREKVSRLVVQKMTFKNVDPSWERLLNRRPDFAAAWKASLQNLMPVVPAMDGCWKTTLEYIAALDLLPPRSTNTGDT